MLSIFCDASSMEVSVYKSHFIHNEIYEDVLEQVKGIFPFKMDHLDPSIEYLVSFMNPNNYRSAD